MDPSLRFLRLVTHLPVSSSFLAASEPRLEMRALRMMSVKWPVE